MQSYRLKQKLPADDELPPAQPRMAGARQQPLARRRGAAGRRRVLHRHPHATAPTDDGGVPWTDPVVLSLSGMLSWLVAAEAFRLAYPAARRGRKVAYLTLAGFVFLVFTLAHVHAQRHGAWEERGARCEERDPKSTPESELTPRASHLAASAGGSP